ncbi:MAG: glycosyltransferase family 2 protein [Acidobacteria bacterium]|nr:glycosyltransferase family 2 protein [Acidobacteriota bacterium]
MSPEVSIVIVTWNGRRHLETCLPAATAQEGIATEVIVVDNGSTDGSAAFVRDRFPGVRLLALGENRGFAGGSNAGARDARGEFLAFLNNDAIPDSTWLRALRSGIDEPSRFLLATSRIVYAHDPSVVDSAGDGWFRAGGAFKRHHGAPAVEAGVSEEVFGICGAACLVAKRVFDELGGFDEDFFASHEDVDLSYRARLRGYRCRYVAGARVRHHGSATLGRVSALAVFHGQRNVEWLYLKNTPASLLLRTLPAHLVYNAAAAAHFARTGLLGTFLKAKLAAVRALPAILHKRAVVQRERTVTARAIAGQFERRWLAAKIREKHFDVSLMEGR